MRVAVLGSWRQEDKKSWGLLETPKTFRAACRQVGSKLIELGHTLIVGSDSEHTADGNAVLGAIEALTAANATVRSPRIMVIRPLSPDGGVPSVNCDDRIRACLSNVRRTRRSGTRSS